jgi:hypothetical protein
MQFYLMSRTVWKSYYRLSLHFTPPPLTIRSSQIAQHANSRTGRDNLNVRYFANDLEDHRSSSYVKITKKHNKILKAYAALDAFARQPLPQDSELWNLPNVIIIPRIAGITSQKWPALLPIFTDKLQRFIAGEPLKNVVDSN